MIIYIYVDKDLSFENLRMFLYSVDYKGKGQMLNSLNPITPGLSVSYLYPALLLFAQSMGFWDRDYKKI